MRKDEMFLHNMISKFNDNLRLFESTYGMGANFKWSYTEDGKKELVIVDIAPIEKLSQARQDALIARTEESIGSLLTPAHKEVDGVLDQAGVALTNAIKGGLMK